LWQARVFFFFRIFLQRCNRRVEDIQKWTYDWSQLCISKCCYICSNCTVICSQQCTCTDNIFIGLVRLMLVMLNDLAHTSHITRLIFCDCFVTAAAKQQFWHVCRYCQVRLRLKHGGGVWPWDCAWFIFDLTVIWRK
jgi:hypothetical protein